MNQFTNLQYSTQGSTPSTFVTSYMARNDATLTTYPVKDDELIWSTNKNSVYEHQRQLLLNNRATLSKNRPNQKSWFNLTTLEGRAFDNTDLSLSKKSINNRANLLQDAFNNGHTILKLVTSFDNNYLKSLNVEKQNSIDFHKDVDEYKLRFAVQNGCLALASSLGYTDPLFVGSIQLDRDHPHAHIAMCETASKNQSNAKYYYNGYENGRLSKQNKNDMRYSIDQTLESNKTLVFFPSNSIEEAQNTNATYEKRYEILSTQKKALMYASLSKNDPLKDKYEDLLLKSLMHHTNLSKKELHKKLKKKHIEPEKKLPNVLLYQINPFNNRNRLSKRLTKLKKAKHKEFLEKAREKRLSNALIYFSNYAKNHPNDKSLIQQYLLPYYQISLANSATKIDYWRLTQFNPIKNIPSTSLKDHHDLTISKQLAKTPFEKAVLENDIHQKTISWHQNKLINAIDVTNNIQVSQYIPTLSMYPLEQYNKKHLKLLIKNNNKLEESLLPNATKAINLLPQNKKIQQFKSDIILANNKLTTSSAPTLKNKTTPTKKTISYKDADDMIFDILN